MTAPVFSMRRLAPAAALFCLTLPGLLSAQDATYPVVVANPIPDITVPVGTTQSVVKLTKTFALSGVTGDIVRFSTSVGDIDVEMLSDAAPNTVSTFLQYASTAGNNSSTNFTYNNTLIQRAVSNFIVQGGGFYVDSSGTIDQIAGRPTIKSEAGIKNTRGTLAMALSTGPDSATGDFYFNVADNANLDISNTSDPNYDGGPFTVFGLVVDGMTAVDAIEALPQRDFSATLGSSFSNVPLVNFDGSSASVSNLVYLNSVTPLPLVPATADGPSLLKIKLKGNTNPGLVTPTIVGKKVKLAYTPGQTGSAVITLKAKKPNAEGKVLVSFTVTVQ